MKVIDLHCDTISKLLLMEYHDMDSSLRKNALDVDLEKMKQGDYLLQNFAMFVPLNNEEATPEELCLTMIDKYYRELEANKDLIRPVLTYKDIEQNIKDNKLSALLTLEEGDVVFNDLAMLRNYYRLGVRMICLTWNYRNIIGSPNFTPVDDLDDATMLRQINTTDGLTLFGVKYIKEMERLGMIIDVSHLGDKGFYDVLDNTTKPFVASHSNARAVCDVARNLTDDMIIKLNERGGVMGLNFCDDFISNDLDGSIENIIKHIDHIKKIASIDVIALGSDFDGIEKRKELDDASKLDDLHKALLAHGYNNEEIEKIFYKNALRVYKEILK